MNLMAKINSFEISTINSSKKIKKLLNLKLILVIILYKDWYVLPERENFGQT